MDKKVKLRDILVDVALQWQASFGIAPSITSSISEYDAAMLVGMSEKEYSDYMRDKTAVAKGTDFVYRNIICKNGTKQLISQYGKIHICVYVYVLFAILLK